MRVTRLGLGLIVLGAAVGCHIVVDEPPPPPRAYYPPPQRPAPPARPEAPLPPEQRYTRLRERRPAPPGQEPWAVMRTRVEKLRSVHPAPIHIAETPIQPAFVATLRARKPARCGLVERAPNEFITVDCQAYKRPRLGLTIADPGRITRLYKAGLLRLDPGAVHPPGAAAYAYPSRTTAGATATPEASPSPTNVTATVALPGGIDHRTDGTEGPVKNQLAVGDCTAFSFSTTMDNAILRLNSKVVVSPTHVWSHYGVPDFAPAFDNNKGRALTDMTSWAYDGPTACRLYRGDTQGYGTDSCNSAYNVTEDSIDAPLTAQITKADTAGEFKPSELSILYQRTNNLPTDPGPDTDALAAAIATGKDIWVGLHFYGGSQGEGKGWFYLNTGNVIGDYAWDPSGGGHGVVLAGYRTEGGVRQFLVHNSWGPTPGTTGSWGDNGYAWISDAMVKQMLIFAATIKVDSVTAPTPAPVPPAPQANGACPTGFSQDPLDNQCRKQCSATTACAATEFCAAVTVTLSGTPPSWCFPLNPLTDDDCTENELVDSVTGLCAPICSDDTRPANGKCN
jgi:Papain family cysteine protease